MSEGVVWPGSTMEMEERRNSPRVQISFPVECRILPEKGYFYTVSKDLSAKGTRIVSDKFICKNNLLKVNINFINSVVSLKARVVWCNKNRVSERYSAGLEIVETDQLKLRNITDFLDRIFSS